MTGCGCRNGHPIGGSAGRIIQSFMDILKEETDFLKEARNAVDIKERLWEYQALDPKLGNDLYVPNVERDVSKDDVLVVEYIDGIPLFDAAHCLKVSPVSHS